MRARRVQPLLEDADSRVVAIARGVLEHLKDDAWFHETRAFAELSLEFCYQLRTELSDVEGFRPHFLGHILVELLLDAELIAAAPERLEAYYAALATLDGALVESVVARAAAEPAVGLAQMIPLFCRERFLSDYGDDAKLLRRLNQVLRRVGLPPAPERLCHWVSSARRRVADRVDELMLAPAPTA
jgi:hypothetical protein